ncbi:MAG: DUF1616 domain-containing protein [Candidatus Woesearchaeota archaeon]
MMLLDIIRIIVGLPLALFIPGYLLSLIFFKELDQLEKIGLGFVLSICVDIAVGLFLGYNKRMKDITGGITATNLWIYLGGITLLLLAVYFLRLSRTKRLLVYP